MNPDSQNPTQEPDENGVPMGDMPQAPTSGTGDDGQAPMPAAPPATPEGGEGDMPAAPEVPTGDDAPVAPAPEKEDEDDGAKW